VIAKAGFILLVLLFGALMFMAGTLAPPGIGQTVTGAANHLAAYLPGAKDVEARLKPESASKAGAPTGAAASAAASAPEALAASSLLIPTPLPEAGKYALQAGQFTHEADASALYAKIQSAKLPAQKVANVQDQGGALWTVVAVGPYASLDEARTANSVVAAQLGLIGPLPLILLPAKS
jgi:cell division septation protein DedD